MKRIGLFALVMCFLLSSVAASADSGVTVKPIGEVFFHWAYNMSGYDEDWDPRLGDDGEGDGEGEKTADRTSPDYGVVDNDFQEFNTTRVYLGAKANLTSSLSAKVVFNANRHDGEWEVYPAYAWGNWKALDALQFRAGILQTAYINFLDWAYGYRYLQKTGYELWFDEHKSDFGMAILGKFPAGFGSYQAGIYNGEGANGDEVNSGKAIDLRATVSPIQVLDALKMLSFTLHLRYEKEDPDAETVDVHVGGVVHYRFQINDDMGINAGLEMDYAMFQPFRDADDEAIIKSFLLSLYADFNIYNAGIFLRYDIFDPDMENDEDTHGYQDEQNLLIVGASYNWHKGIAMALSYERWGYAAEVVDDDGDDVILPPDQFLKLNWRFAF